jgi:excinuclease UvrABC nuclease subunit
MNSWSDMYPYSEAYVKQHAPLAGGVYRLIYQKGNDYYVFYVGQSDNLQRRLLEHLGASEKDLCIKRHLRDYSCSFRYIEISSLDERLRVESEQIKKYNPTCNG